MTSRLSSHVFQWDGITDRRALKPRRFCVCFLPEDHPRHEVPETPAEVVAVQRRILGETEHEQEPT